MAVLWRAGPSTVEQVRDGLAKNSRGAYTTVQTVLNRLAKRGLLARERTGIAIVYTPTMSEAEYVALELRRTLDSASLAARQTALAELVGALEADREVIAELAKEAEKKRGRASK